MAELRSLLKKQERVRLYAISIDGRERSRELAAKIAADGKGALPFPLLSDPGHQVIEAYGLRDHSYDGKQYEDISFEGIPKAAVYVIDKRGRVAWMKVEEDYKQRPSNADIRRALDRLKN